MNLNKKMPQELSGGKKYSLGFLYFLALDFYDKQSI
jgi:hypothetical protein